MKLSVRALTIVSALLGGGAMLVGLLNLAWPSYGIEFLPAGSWSRGCTTRSRWPAVGRLSVDLSRGRAAVRIIGLSGRQTSKRPR
jgi:hypothetical protein